jgi:phosphatidylserine/phosphatidylglycerophosphate/cardiolipin synthase-like enzyme
VKGRDRIRRAVRDGLTEAPRVDEGGSPPAWANELADLLIMAERSGGRDQVAISVVHAIEEVSRRTDAVRVVATGIAWLGGGVAAVERTMADLVASAKQEIVLTAYSMTLGSERIWDELERALATGVRCTLVIDRYDQQDAEARTLLGRLATMYPATMQMFEFVPVDDRDGLHAKVVVVDREAALIGSANLSHRGLVSAHELSVVVEGPTAGQIVEQVERLLRSPSVHRIT